MSFAAVHIPEFPISAWVYRAPHLKTRPLVLLRGTPPQEGVASVNTVANASGISHGMSKVQAEAACAACFRSRDMEEERTAYARVLEIADRFSPRVQGIATPANDYANRDRLSASLLIDRSGTRSLFGNAQTYAKRLHGELASAGFVSSIATAPNADAALILARSTQSIVCVDERDLQQNLAGLPTSLLECDPKTQTLLRPLGCQESRSTRSPARNRAHQQAWAAGQPAAAAGPRRSSLLTRS